MLIGSKEDPIKEPEEARGARVTTVHDDADLSSDEASCSSQVISERLVQLERHDRYKDEVENLDVEPNQWRKDLEEQATTESQTTSQNVDKVRKLTTQVEKWRRKFEELEKQKQASDEAQTTCADNIRSLNAEIEDLRNICQNMEKMLEEEPAEVARLKRTNVKLIKQLDQRKKMLQKVQSKIRSQNTEIKTLTCENEELKSLVESRDNVDADAGRLHAGCQTEIVKLNKTNEEMREELSETRHKYELLQKLHDYLQIKYLELQSRASTMTKVTLAQVNRAITLATKATPWANIHMSSPSPAATRQFPRAATSPTSRATMAITSHTAAPSTSPSTPTATVMPLPDPAKPTQTRRTEPIASLAHSSPRITSPLVQGIPQQQRQRALVQGAHGRGGQIMRRQPRSHPVGRSQRSRGRGRSLYRQQPY